MSLVAINYVAYRVSDLGVVRPAAGADVTIYERGTITEATVYTTDAGTVEATQPLVADAYGRVIGFVEPNDYDISVSGTGFSTFEVPWEAIAFDGTKTQAAEGTNVPVFTVVPATATGAADFQVQMQSYANDGAGAGTFNHGVWFGFDASAYAGGATSNAPGIYMGFEDNFHDTAGADVGEEKYGPEWYIGYLTPDKTSVGPADLRMFYTRVKGGRVNSGPETKSVQTWIDIGGGATGFFAIMAGQVAGVELAVFNNDSTYIRKQTQFTNDGVGLEVKPDDVAQIYAQLNINCQVSGGYPVVHFKTADTGRWSIVGGSSEFYFEDVQNASRKHIQLVPGASDLVADTILKSKMTIKGQQGSLTIAPDDAYAQVNLKAPGVGSAGAFAILAYWDAGTPRWSLAGSTASFYLEDTTNARKHVEFTPGASDTTAVTVFKSNLQVMGLFGCNGNAPVAKASAITSPAADAAELKTAVDAIRVALTNVGITA